MPRHEAARNDDCELLVAVLALLRLPQDEESMGQEDVAAVAAQRRIRTTAKRIASGAPTDEASSTSITSNLSALTRLCDNKFLTYSYESIPLVWRSIYIGAQLLQACHALTAFDLARQGAVLSRCIRDLDLALIVAGAGSTEQGHLCHQIIASLQAKLLEVDPSCSTQTLRRSSGDRPPRKRSRWAPSDVLSPTACDAIQATTPVLDFDFEHAPSFIELAAPDSVLRSKPFVVRSYAQGSGWPAVQPGPDGPSWSSMQHLLRSAGPARVVPIEVGANYIRNDWGQDVMLWSDFLRQCRWGDDEVPIGAKDEQAGSADCSNRHMLYMAQYDLASQFPALESDYVLPDYVFTSPPPPSEWPTYRPPSTSDGVINNLWIGPAGTVSPPHYDPFYNCFVQVVGYKEVWVAPPYCKPSKINRTSEQASVFQSCATETNVSADTDNKGSITESLMANTANIDVFDSHEAVPEFVRSAAYKAVLGPGDLLYMPPECCRVGPGKVSESLPTLTVKHAQTSSSGEGAFAAAITIIDLRVLQLRNSTTLSS
ncbi:predicted hydroxylase [Pseudozyma hubeiensis SY62]|uniref:Predicted hydroxylase n=1 Tax=Pseudozyma hubeiensis (strain SY62) TaxID=1305764 RepID=R9P0E8_PSEHS|nr:predicted hydroxylase [Pseudozyma hubeiensis SY62]GAC94673.1 predicted hydroxylase [Pseudozyma hubeiensis SY62]